MEKLPAEVEAVSPPRPARLREVALLFTRLGFTAFGGPAAHTAMMEDEVVRRRGWIDRRHFLDLVATLNFIPGPNSTELAIHLGLIRAGHAGLVVAGACFITPAVLIILPLAWAYVRYGTTVPEVRQLLAGVNAAVLAVLAAACWRFAKASIKDAFTATVAGLALVAAFVTTARPGWQPELVILAVAALAGAIRYGRPRPLPVLSLALPLAASADARSQMLRLALFFLKVGGTLFGSGYVLVSYLRSGLVEQHGWMTERQLLDAVAVGQVTPGPLLTTATFVGYVLGHRFTGGSVAGGAAGGVLATAAIFAPAFVLVAIVGPLLPRVRQNRHARGALDAMNAAVAALVLVVTIQLARATFFTPPPAPFAFRTADPLPLALFAASLLALLKWNLNSTWLVLGAGIVGLLRGWLT
jgi:chromate transporter